MENIITVIIGIVCIVIGFFNRKGNIEMLHSYHRKRVTEENRLPFGKLVGIGMIIIGISVIALGILMYFAESFQQDVYMTAGYIVFGVGMAIGFGITFYAMKKYNNGIF